MTKKELYVELAADLSQFWHRDAALLEHNPDAWALAWSIDHWLFAHRENPQVGREQYQRNCASLRDCYHVGALVPSSGGRVPCPKEGHMQEGTR